MSSQVSKRLLKQFRCKYLYFPKVLESSRLRASLFMSASERILNFFFLLSHFFHITSTFPFSLSIPSCDWLCKKKKISFIFLSSSHASLERNFLNFQGLILISSADMCTRIIHWVGCRVMWWQLWMMNFFHNDFIAKCLLEKRRVMPNE